MPVSIATACFSGFGRTEPQAHAAAAGAEPAGATVTLPGITTLDDLWNALSDAGTIGFGSSIYIRTSAAADTGSPATPTSSHDPSSVPESGGTRSTGATGARVQAEPMSTLERHVQSRTSPW